MRPADTTRTFSHDTLPSTSAGFQPTQLEDDCKVSLPTDPTLYGAKIIDCQEGATPRTLRIALVQGAVTLMDHSVGYLRRHKIEPVFLGSPEEILRRLEHSLEEWDTLVYPICAQWQRSLDFAREARLIRERHGAPPRPRVLILSFIEQLPVTAHWFRQTNGTRYSVFSSEENLVRTLWAMCDDVAKAERSCRLHLRFVHAGNPSGLGCISGERIVAAYGSFSPGEEQQIPSSKSVLDFINLLAASRWRSRSAIELVDLISRQPLYRRKNGSAGTLSSGSVKTYVSRAEDALFSLWYRSGNLGEPPTVIAKESRGNKEIAYRLLCTAEFEHI